MSNGASNSAALATGGRGNPRSSGYERVVADWYREPPWIVDALLNREPIVGAVLDPACGGGTIPARCLARGIPAVGSDLIARGFGTVADFMDRTEPCDNVICNPPFSLAQQFVEVALKVARHKVIIIQRLAFAEGQKRRLMFETTPIARIWVSSRRCSMPPGHGFGDGERERWGALKHHEGRGGAIAYAWFVWQHGHVGPPTLGWLP